MRGSKQRAPWCTESCLLNRHVCRLRVKASNWRSEPSRQRSIPKAQTQGLFVCLRGTHIRANITQITCCDTKKQLYFRLILLSPLVNKTLTTSVTQSNLWDRQLNTGISVPWTFLPLTGSKTPKARVCSLCLQVKNYSSLINPDG